MDIVFKIDGSTVAKHTAQSYASATEMSICLGVKNGGANAEVLNAQYVGCTQLR